MVLERPLCVSGLGFSYMFVVLSAQLLEITCTVPTCEHILVRFVAFQNEKIISHETTCLCYVRPDAPQHNAQHTKNTMYYSGIVHRFLFYESGPLNGFLHFEMSHFSCRAKQKSDYHIISLRKQGLLLWKAHSELEGRRGGSFPESYLLWARLLLSWEGWTVTLNQLQVAVAQAHLWGGRGHRRRAHMLALPVKDLRTCSEEDYPSHNSRTLPTHMLAIPVKDLLWGGLPRPGPCLHICWLSQWRTSFERTIPATPAGPWLQRSA